MVDSVVDNYSMRTERRAEIKLEFSEKTKVSEVENFLGKTHGLLATNPQEILKFSAFLSEYSKNGSTITIEYFTPAFTMAEFNKVKQGVNLQLMELIEKEKMELASAGNTINILGAEGEAPKSNPIL